MMDDARLWLSTLWNRRKQDVRMVTSYVRAGQGIELLRSRAPMRLDTPAPGTVGIEFTNACQLRCQHCDAQHPDIRGRAGYMTESTFATLVSQLRELRIRNLRVIGGGEPTLHRRFAVWLPRLRPLAPYLSVTTNGQRMTPEISYAILDNVDVLEISVAGDDAASFERSRAGGDFEKTLENLRWLRARQRAIRSRCMIQIRVMLRPSEEPARKRLLQFWSAYGDVVSTQRLQDYFGQAGDVYPTPRPTGHPPCVQPFRIMGVRWNGDVPLCRGSAFQAGVPVGVRLGNINSTTLAAMWHGPIIRDYRKGHLRGDPALMPICKGCPDAQAPMWRKRYDNNVHLSATDANRDSSTFVPLASLRARPPTNRT